MSGSEAHGSYKAEEFSAPFPGFLGFAGANQRKSLFLRGCKMGLLAIPGPKPLPPSNPRGGLSTIPPLDQCVGAEHCPLCHSRCVSHHRVCGSSDAVRNTGRLRVERRWGLLPGSSMGPKAVLEHSFKGIPWGATARTEDLTQLLSQQHPHATAMPEVFLPQ